MASFGTLQSDTVATGVPGAFSQQHTTFAYELDIEKLREESGTTPESGDQIATMVVPQGFVILGGYIEVVIPPSAGGTSVGALIANSGDLDIVVNTALTGSAGQRIYSTVDDTDPDAIGNFNPIMIIEENPLFRILNFATGGTALADGVFNIGITGIYMHGRASKTTGNVPPVA